MIHSLKGKITSVKNSLEDPLSAFLSWVESKKITLYPAQEEAILEIFSGKNVFLNTPTGSGKSLVATALHFESLVSSRRSVYTCPIKALVNEKWRALCEDFGPENVGLSTGDATVNRDAPILCCTAEILSNMALSEGETLNIRDIVMDEFHYYAEKERGIAWQIPLLSLPQSRFLLMSATVGNTEFFEQEMTKRNGLESITIRSNDRPVPLQFSYSEEDLANEVQKLLNQGAAPIYVVHFSQSEAAKSAQNLSCLEIATKEEREKIGKAISDARFSSPYGPEIKRWLRLGVGLHHAGLLPKYRILTEKLAQRGLLKIICGTDTLGVGVNVPIRTVLFTKLCKFNGEKTAILSVRDFHQIAGRAGRKGFDTIGYVVAQAPAHTIENKKLEAKAKRTGKKVVKQKPPEKGYAPWDESTFRKLIESSPEALRSSFHISHSTLLNVLSRKTDGCRAFKNLIRDCHESIASKKALRKRAMQLFRALVENQIVTLHAPSAQGLSKTHVNIDLQDNFSMNEPLSLYLIDTLPKLDRNDPDYALNALSLVESIVENPDVILRRQLDRVKTEKLAQLKAEGVDYDKRMEELEKMEYPKPLRDFIYDSFNAFAQIHPWVETNIEPKSIVREMFENFSTFSSYIKQYDLERSEAILLRHISSVYKTLSQTVPEIFKDETIFEMENFLEEMLRRVDSSLLEEWERMKNPNFNPEEEPEKIFEGKMLQTISQKEKEARFIQRCRMRIFEWLSLIAQKKYGEALDMLADDLDEGVILQDENHVPWTEKRMDEIFETYEKEHGKFRLDTEGRALKNTLVHEEGTNLFVEQILSDWENQNDWSIRFHIPKDLSEEGNIPLLRLDSIGERVL